MRLIDKGNDDYNLVAGPVIIELSRGINHLTGKITWRLWHVRVNRMTVHANNGGKKLSDPNLIRVLEAMRRAISS